MRMELLGFELSVTWLLVISVVLMLAWYDWWCHQYFQRRGIPVADYIPFFGNLLQFRIGLHNIFTEYRKKYGKVVGIYEFRSPSLVITDPDILKNVLVKNFSNFYNRRRFPLTQKPINRGLTQLEDEEWKEARSVVTPSFSSAKMRQMSAMINECCDTLMSSISKAREGGKAIDCRKLFGAFTMDVVAQCGFGLQVKSQENSDDQFVKNAVRAFKDFDFLRPTLMLAAAFPFLGPILTFLNVSIFDPTCIKFFMDVTEAACKMRKEEGNKTSKRVDILQLLLNAHNDTDIDPEDKQLTELIQGKGTIQRKPLSTTDIMAQSLLFFLAGYETTNTLLSFTAYLLATNQDVQEKLHAEIENLDPSRDKLGYDAVSKLEYLDMVINETLRMYPPAANFDRMCNKTTNFDGLTIEKGVRVIVGVWPLHYDEEYWPNPTKFDPERFSADNKGSIKQCTFLPFGGGPRTCIGMRFALLEAKMALVRVLQQYRFDVCSETEIPLTLGKTTLTAPKSIMLNAVPRN